MPVNFGTVDVLANVVDQAAASVLSTKIRNWVTPSSDGDNTLAELRAGSLWTYSNSPTFSRNYVDMDATGSYLWNNALPVLSPASTVVAARFYRWQGLVAIASYVALRSAFPDWGGQVEAVAAVIPGVNWMPGDDFVSGIRGQRLNMGDRLRQVWHEFQQRGFDAFRVVPAHINEDLVAQFGFGEEALSPATHLFVGVLAADHNLSHQFVNNPAGVAAEFHQKFGLEVPAADLNHMVEKVAQAPALKQKLMR